MVKSKIVFKDKQNDKVIKGEIIEDNSIFVKVKCDNSIYEIGKVRDYVIKTPTEAKK
jgi:hypothetical protein